MTRILVAGIGNVFLGDDGFGVEVARMYSRQPLLPDVQVTDFGIRGMDLVYALLDDRDSVIFIDATQRGEPPGTLYLLEPEIEDGGEVSLDAHAMDPVKVLSLARAMGAKSTTTYIIGCEPEFVPEADDPEIYMNLTDPVRAACGRAVEMVDQLVRRLSDADESGEPAVPENTLVERR